MEKESFSNIILKDDKVVIRDDDGRFALVLHTNGLSCFYSFSLFYAQVEIGFNSPCYNITKGGKGFFFTFVVEVINGCQVAEPINVTLEIPDGEA